MALPDDGEITTTSLTVDEYRSLLNDLVADVAKGYTEYSSTRSYDKGAVVLAGDYWPYISQLDGNSGNDPLVDDGTNWRIDDKALTVFAALFTQGIQSDICRLVVGTTVDPFSYGIFSDNDGYTLWNIEAVSGTLSGTFSKVSGTGSGLIGSGARIDGVNSGDIGSAAYYDVTQSSEDTTNGSNGQPRVLRVGDGGINANITSLTTDNGGWLTRYSGSPSSFPKEVLRDSTSGPDGGYYYPVIFAYNQDSIETKTIQAWPLSNSTAPKWTTMDDVGVMSDWYTIFSSFDTANSISDYNTASPTDNKPVTPNGLKIALNSDGSAPMFSSRSWVNFNGTGTVSIRDSGNVLSISDLGTGQYEITLIDAVNENSAVWVSGNVSSGGANAQVVKANMTSSTTILIRCTAGSNADTDLEFISVGVVG